MNHLKKNVKKKIRVVLGCARIPKVVDEGGKFGAILLKTCYLLPFLLMLHCGPSLLLQHYAFVVFLAGTLSLLPFESTTPLPQHLVQCSAQSRKFSWDPQSLCLSNVCPAAQPVAGPWALPSSSKF